MKKGWGILLLFLFILLGNSLKCVAQIDTERVISIGQNALYFKDYVLAIQYFNSAIKNDPNRAEPYYYRGLAKYSLDDYLGAESDAKLCLDRNPYIVGAYYLRAISRHTLGQDSLAKEDYSVVLRNNPDHKGALHNYALLSIRTNDTIIARQTLDHLQRFFPSYAEGYMIDGGLHLEQKDTLGAVDLFQKALTLSPRLVGAYVSLSEIAYNRAAYKEAEGYIDNAIAQDNNVPQLFINRGLIRYRLKNIRGSMSDYSTAIELDPNNKLALYNRALLRTQVGEVNAAQEDFNRVIQLDPENYFALFNRALISNQIGDYELAVSDLSKIIKRYPTFVPAFFQRSEAHKHLGLIRESKQDLYHASKLLYDAETLRQASGQQAMEDQYEGEQNDIRDDRDENIRKFKYLVHNSRNKSYDDLYKDESIRGRVQDRDVIVAPEPMYSLSYYVLEEDQIKGESTGEYAALLDLPEYEYAIQVVRRLPQLTQEMVDMHIARVQSFDVDKMSNAHELLKYAMDQVTLKDYEMAVATFSLIINAMPDDPASLFQRGVSRFLAFEAKSKDFIEDTDRPYDLLKDINESKDYLLRKAIAQESIRDFEAVLELVPNYAPALYNIGYIYASMGQFIRAIEYYDRAIQMEPSMAAAYFNRGLAYYSIGEKIKGDHDLSLAGSLGIYKAYSIIRRMK